MPLLRTPQARPGVTGGICPRGAVERTNLARNSSHQVAAAVAGISDAPGEQTMTASVLAQSVERISRTTQENDRAAGAVDVQAGKLNGLADMREGVISGFRRQPVPH